MRLSQIGSTIAATAAAATGGAGPGSFAWKLSDVTGAYYRKVMSSANPQFSGVQGTVTLPTPAFDPARYFNSPAGIDDYRTGPLDVPDVYLGGTARGHELDCGLSWDRVYDGQGRATYTDRAQQTDGRDPARRFVRSIDGTVPIVVDGDGRTVARGAEADTLMKRLRPNFAYRPYWRTTNGQGNQWNNPPKNSPQNIYYYPGEQVSMRLSTTGANQMQLSFDRDRDPSGALRLAIPFRQDGFGTGAPQRFKRIVSLDQFVVGRGGQRAANTGGVVPTRTALTGTVWQRSEILQSGGAAVIPIHGSSFAVVAGRDSARRYDTIFRRSNITSVGGETLDITPLASRPPNR